MLFPFTIYPVYAVCCSCLMGYGFYEPMDEGGEGGERGGGRCHSLYAIQREIILLYVS